MHGASLKRAADGLRNHVTRLAAVADHTVLFNRSIIGGGIAAGFVLQSRYTRWKTPFNQ
jgi:hypothetical protein